MFALSINGKHDRNDSIEELLKEFACPITEQDMYDMLVQSFDLASGCEFVKDNDVYVIEKV